MAFAGKIAHTHNNKTKSLTFTESLTFTKHKTQKWPKSKTVKTVDYNCAYVSIMAVLVIFPVILLNLKMPSIGEQGIKIK